MLDIGSWMLASDNMALAAVHGLVIAEKCSSPVCLGLGLGLFGGSENRKLKTENQSQVHRAPWLPPHPTKMPMTIRSDGNCLAAGFRLRLTCFKSASQSLFALVWFWFWFCSIYIYANARLGRYIQFFTWISLCIYIYTYSLHIC